MSVQHYPEILQGSDEWFEVRRGILTASEMKLIITPTLKFAANDKSRSHLFELLAQRISGYVEPHYIGDDMMRGHEDEVLAKQKYAEKYAPITDCGFITNDDHGFMLGYSPDGLVGDDGLVEVKSRRQKFQIETIVSKEVPAEFSLQVQTGLIVSKRKWLDFISYCGGLPMWTYRVYPDATVQAAILEASYNFYKNMDERMAEYHAIMNDGKTRLIETERTIIQDIEID